MDEYDSLGDLKYGLAPFSGLPAWRMNSENLQNACAHSGLTGHICAVVFRQRIVPEAALETLPLRQYGFKEGSKIVVVRKGVQAGHEREVSRASEESQDAEASVEMLALRSSTCTNLQSIPDRQRSPSLSCQPPTSALSIESLLPQTRSDAHVAVSDWLFTQHSIRNTVNAYIPLSIKSPFAECEDDRAEAAAFVGSEHNAASRSSTTEVTQVRIAEDIDIFDDRDFPELRSASDDSSLPSRPLSHYGEPSIRSNSDDGMPTGSPDATNTPDAENMEHTPAPCYNLPVAPVPPVASGLPLPASPVFQTPMKQPVSPVIFGQRRAASKRNPSWYLSDGDTSNFDAQAERASRTRSFRKPSPEL